MQTQMAKQGNFITPSLFLSVKQKLVPMTILEHVYLFAVPSALTINQTRTVGLGILEDDCSGWVRGHVRTGFFHAFDDFKRWTLHILDNYTRILKAVGIYDAVWAFHDCLTLGNREVMRAILECYQPTTSKAECEYILLDNELAIESEEFQALFFLVMAYFEYTRES